MSISDKKIQEALSKISIKKKEVFAETVMKKFTFTDEEENDPVNQVKRIIAMKDSFMLMDKNLNTNSMEVYDAIIDNLSTTLNEHAKILIDHAKEVVSNT